MKKTFLARRNALFSSTNVSWGSYALVGSVLLLFVRLLAPNFFWQVFAPVFRSANFVANESHLFFASFGNTATLTLQNEKLSNENEILISENQALLQKTTSLEALFSVPTGRKNVIGILAEVIARPPESPYDMLVLAKGSTAGITLGMEAFGEGGVPIGIVSSVTADFSRTTLFSSPGMKTHGWIGNAHLPITIMGAGGGVMSASLARSAPIAVGDSVWAPGPGALPIGKVVRIDSNPSLPSATIRIMPTLNVFSITWVELRDTGTALWSALSQATSTLP